MSERELKKVVEKIGNPFQGKERSQKEYQKKQSWEMKLFSESPCIPSSTNNFQKYLNINVAASALLNIL